MLQPKLLVGISLLAVQYAPAADQKHKQPMARHEQGRFVAFAYTATGNLTAEGKPPVAGITIAADPRVLPMGTRVRISKAGPWSGEYRVGDVGGAIKGNKIDVFVPTRAEAIEFGRRNVLLTVLSLPRRSAPATASRARKAPEPEQSAANRSTCKGCGNGRSEAIMALDETRGHGSESLGRSVATRRAGELPGESDPREGGGS